MNGLLVYDTRYIKAKSGTFGGKVCTSFPSLNVTEDAAECVIKKMTKICAHFKIETDATHNLIDDFFSNFVCHRTFP